MELLRKPEVQKLRLAEVDLADESSIIAALPKSVLLSLAHKYTNQTCQMNHVCPKKYSGVSISNLQDALTHCF